MEENLLNAFFERRRAIAEMADVATSEARKKLAERVLAVVSGFPKPVLVRFLSLSAKQREQHLDVLQELNSQDGKVRMSRWLAKIVPVEVLFLTVVQ
jgi:hypothetical protein